MVRDAIYMDPLLRTTAESGGATINFHNISFIRPFLVHFIEAYFGSTWNSSVPDTHEVSRVSSFQGWICTTKHILVKCP